MRSVIRRRRTRRRSCSASRPAQRSAWGLPAPSRSAQESRARMNIYVWQPSVRPAATEFDFSTARRASGERSAAGKRKRASSWQSNLPRQARLCRRQGTYSRAGSMIKLRDSAIQFPGPQVMTHRTHIAQFDPTPASAKQWLIWRSSGLPLGTHELSTSTCEITSSNLSSVFKSGATGSSNSNSNSCCALTPEQTDITTTRASSAQPTGHAQLRGVAFGLVTFGTPPCGVFLQSSSVAISSTESARTRPWPS